MVFCITELDVGGAEKAVVRIATGLKELGWSVRVISLRDAGAMARPLQDAGIEVEALQCRNFADVRCFWRLRAALRARLEERGQRVAALEQELAEARRTGAAARRRLDKQEQLYVALRGELEAKKDRLRTQEEQLQRLQALKVAIAAEPPPPLSETEPS